MTKKKTAATSLDTFLEGLIKDYGLPTEELSLNQTFFSEGKLPSTLSSELKPTADYPVGISRDKGTIINK